MPFGPDQWGSLALALIFLLAFVLWKRADRPRADDADVLWPGEPDIYDQDDEVER